MKFNSIIIILFIIIGLSKNSEEDDDNYCEDFSEDLTEEELEDIKDKKLIKFETFETINIFFNGIVFTVTETGTYEIETNCSVAMAFYDNQGKSITCFEDKGNINVKKDDIIIGLFLFLTYDRGIKITITRKTEVVRSSNFLPFEPINIIKESDFDTSSIKKDPLTPAEVKYKKRTGNYLYINSNNPEVVKDIDLNKAFIRLDISNKEIFFTFEHSTYFVNSDIIYSGFQVRNTGTKDLKVIIKNIGFQYNGKGHFLGQKEWIDFYNLKFKLLNKNNWNEKQIKNFESLINFSDEYEPSNYQSETYIIPPGVYFYVIGGTIEDAYNNINIFNTANINVKKTVINGVVLFEVIGNAEGAYFIYNDINIPKTDRTSYQGYISKREDNNEIGAQYIGYDNCNGVVDNSMTWEFNDLTKEQSLPVFYTNYYSDTAKNQGQEPYSEILTTEHTIYSDIWYTHLNPNDGKDAVGEDMTKFITINEEGKNIIIDNEHYDGRGSFANIGNWMIDYIDNFNFVNRGDKNRNISVLIGHGYQGSIACFVRNSKLEMIEGTEQFTVYIPDSDLNSNDSIKDIFNYTFQVPSHSVIQIYVEYNLLANSYGNVTHSIYLYEAPNVTLDNYKNYLSVNILYIIFGFLILCS